MYGYQLVLAHPSRERHVALRCVAREHYGTPEKLLRAQGMLATYRSWVVLSFISAQASSPRARPVPLDMWAEPPGSLVNTSV